MTLDERIAAYVDACDPAISGQEGHNKTFSVACSLVNGFDLSGSAALFWLKRFNERCQPPWSERDLEHKIQSAQGATHEKARGHLIGNGPAHRGHSSWNGGSNQNSAPSPKRTPTEHATWWLSGKSIGQEEFVASSQLAIPAPPGDALIAFLEMLYDGQDNLNAVWSFILEDGKARPCGPGQTKSRDQWTRYVQEQGIPQSLAGVWLRPNPCQPAGSGKDGAVTDSDVVAHRFVLLESDSIPLDIQLALFAGWKLLPIVAVILSGGKSAHAWVRLDAGNSKEYSETVRRLLTALAPFGIDPKNKNPSRLSRMPSAQRTYGAEDSGLQQLLWLNPGKGKLSSQDLAYFEESLELPRLEEKPFRRIVNDALARYEYLSEHKNELGVPTGIADFDRDTGGLHPGQMTVIAAETGAGKSSIAISIANAALKANKHVCLFTLEMDNDEIADLLFAMRAQVQRSHFNTGEFTPEEMQRIVSEAHPLRNAPFWTYDESVMNVAQMRARVLQLKRDGRIDLAIVDYAQIVLPKNGQTPREQQVAEIARDIRALAKDVRIPIIVLSQLNDEGRLRESRVISHEAHSVIVLVNKEAENQVIFDVRKGRRIRKKEYPLFYDPATCLFASAAKISQDDVPPETSRNYWNI
jgi:KaiC/GvpD/RAD55 family RecA-like ATPase